MFAMSKIYSLYTQFFPPRPTLTGSNLPSQAGKVFIVTGASSGMGFELAKILYTAGGTVYVMTRTESDALKAIDAIEESSKGSTSKPGVIKFIRLDLADLSTIPASVAAFRSAETRLDVLFNNAGVCNVPLEHKTPQGLESQVGINCVGPFLLTKLLLPLLTSTAARAPANSVRIVWNSSILVDMMAPKGGIRTRQLTNPDGNMDEHYSSSKAGNWFLASEYHRLIQNTGVISLTQNPGQLRTNIWRDAPGYIYYPLLPVLARSIYGAYTSLWAGFSEDVTMKDGGRYVIPYGRWHKSPRNDILQALKDKKDGGTGQAIEFWDWCEDRVKPYVPREQ